MSAQHEQAWDALVGRFLEYADWEETGSVSRAKKFITTVTAALSVIPVNAQIGGLSGERAQFPHQYWQAQKMEARAFVARRSVRRISHTNPCGASFRR